MLPLQLAMRLGAALRGIRNAADHIDESTRLLNHRGFVARGDELLAACRRDGKPLSVVVFDCADLMEVRAIYGTQVARQLMTRLVRKLGTLCGERGFVARTGQAEFTVVLPRLGRDRALALVHRVLGNPMRIELDAGDSEIVMVPDFLVDASGADTATVDELHRELRRDIARMRQRELRHHQRMQRERERHSRPMGMTQPAALALA